VRKTIPPNIEPDLPYFGFTKMSVKDSFFWSLLSLMALFNCVAKYTVTELRKMALKQVKNSPLNNKVKDNLFNRDLHRYHRWVDDFTSGKIGIDPKMYTIEALAVKLLRPIIVISTLARHGYKAIFPLNLHGVPDRPPFIFGLYERDGEEIFLPFFINKQAEFCLDSLKGRMEIIAYSAKTVPEGFRSRSILDLEVYSILNSLYSMQRFISGVRVTLLTDSRVLYYLFSAKIGNSCVKIKRWVLKMISDYPMVVLQFVRTNSNLADFLTREGMLPGDAEKFQLKDVEIRDIFEHLPKHTFTLKEWSTWVEQHPEFLEIKNTKAVVLSINRGIDNLKEYLSPLVIVQKKIDRENIVFYQKRQFPDIYAECLAAENFEIEKQTNGDTLVYKLITDMLMVYVLGEPKILMPPKLVGALLAYFHLKGHGGIKKMMAELRSYYFPTMYTQVKNFVASCNSCFLSYRGKHKVKMGVYPMPSRPFEEVILDLCENLNTVGGYSHLLLMQCTFSSFIIIIPLKTKTSNEVTRAILNCVLQQFNVTRLHSDNGPCFRNLDWVRTMSALNVHVIGSSALHPAGRGMIESSVNVVKLLLRKMLATHKDLNWEFLPFLVSKIMNNSVNPSTGFSPYTMVYGADHAVPTFLQVEPTAMPHFSVRPAKERIKALTKEISEITSTAQEKLTEIRMKAADRVNKSRKEVHFKPGDYIFVIDRAIIPGNPRVLKTKLSPSPYICVRSLFTTSIVQRISDGFVSVYSNSDLKKYDKISPLFNSLPVEVNKVLLHDFKDLLDSDLCTIARFDPLTAPSKAIHLFDSSNSEVEIVGGEIVAGNLQEEPQEISINIPLKEKPLKTSKENENLVDEDDDFDQFIGEEMTDNRFEGDAQDRDTDTEDDQNITENELLKEIVRDSEEEENRRLERIEEEEEEEEDEDLELPTGRANNRPLRFGRVYQK
jgi:hypothetical protein